MKISKQLLVGIVSVIVIIAITLYLSLSLKRTPAIAFTAVKKADITQAVSVDGAVQAAQDLSLSFQTGGTISEIDVVEGQAVKKGQVLMKLNTSSLSAAVNQAQAAVESAQANYQKVINGATGAQLNVSQAAVQTAQTALANASTSLQSTIAQQNLIVSNAQSALLNSGLVASPASTNLAGSNPTITGTYTSSQQGQYQITISSTGSGQIFSYTGLESGSGQVSSAGSVPLGTKGLYVQFPSGQIPTNNSWTISIPNTQAASYLTNLNAYNAALQAQNQAVISGQSAVSNAQAQLAQAQDNLQLQQTPARPEDVATAQAQVATAQAQLQAAQSNYGNAVLSAPIDGIITSVDVKIGENTQTATFAPGVEVVKMISSQKFQMVAYVAENDVGKIKLGDNAEITLDAYGSNTPFPATVIAIDPAATINNGVSTYKTTLEFSQEDPRIKEGMNGNVVITDQTDQQALIVPATAIIKKDSQEFVLSDAGNGKVTQTQIQTGIVDLNGNVEVTSGLSQGQMIASFGNQ